jgi:microcystin-dependent protein
MASVLLSPYGNGQQFFDNNGIPLSGGLLYTYQAGSSTPLVTYTDNGGTVANANPIVLDASGRTPQEIWLLTGYSYKFVLQTADAVLIQTLDNIYPILQNAPETSPSIPTGGIIIWSGSTGSIPSGWLLCDGNNGTPDLRDRFIVGAGNTYAVNANGGSADAIVVTHTHTATSTSVVTDPGHDHDAYSGNGTLDVGAYIAGGLVRPGQPFNSTEVATTGITVATTTTNASSGTSGTNANLPPYYALAYIIKT